MTALTNGGRAQLSDHYKEHTDGHWIVCRHSGYVVTWDGGEIYRYRRSYAEMLCDLMRGAYRRGMAAATDVGTFDGVPSK